MDPTKETEPTRAVRVFDTTLRDGEQTPGVHFDVATKVQIAERLEATGVDTIEAGFPVSSPGDAEAVREIARNVARIEVCALARAVQGDVDAVAQALDRAARPICHIVLGASDIHLRSKLRMSRADALRRVHETVRYARRIFDEVMFSPEDATRAERVFLRQMVTTAIDAGATRINVPDTVGFASPNEYASAIRDIVYTVPENVIVSAHCHDDLGMATANTIAAVDAGAGEVQVTVNGIGERAGNAAMEQIVTTLAIKHRIVTGVDTKQLPGLSRIVAEASGVVVPPNAPVVGANAFRHSSGIHQAAILADPHTYACIAPEAMGVTGHEMVLTARSGRHAIASVVRSAGFSPTPSEVDAMYTVFLQLADDARGAVSQDEVIRIATTVCGGKPVSV